MELINNLASDQHLDAWTDLAGSGGERQRIASQLIGNLESALAILANLSSAQGEEFLKISENVYVTIKPFLVQEANRTIEAAFPSESSALGTRWLEQRFTLNLQVSLLDQQQQQGSSSQVDAKLHLSDDQQQQQTGKLISEMSSLTGEGSVSRGRAVRKRVNKLGQLKLSSFACSCSSLSSFSFALSLLLPLGSALVVKLEFNSGRPN